ncbi:hypothetical protein TL16_g13056 [Triparma laevis f. inornata]|uniref:LMBR1-like membrane protein n=1 Tax=Triparma laevis f. inornata TaxID=1714386 RepID=A0A9W7BQQ2_9STRA|nr:hypothetical protein TL16_g13056 [Triparma laevis f. inornata]
MDWFLIAVTVVGFIILLVINVYLIVLYQHPDDKNEALLPKILILIGFTIAQGSVLLLPLDVANNEGYAGCSSGFDTDSCGGLNMNLLWEIIYITILVYVTFFIPFAIFYYEADDGMGNSGESMFCGALKYEILVLIASTLTLVLMYSYLGTTNIPVTTYTAAVASHTSWTISAGSWPRHMDAIEFAEAQLSVRTRVNELIEIGELLKRERVTKAESSLGYWANRRSNKNDRQTVNKFKQAVFMLENDVEELKLCHENYASYNPLVPIFQLFLGLISMILSLLWILQICLFILPSPPLTPFLNDYFEWFDTWFSLFGVISVAVFSMYLQACVVKGCFKFGVRFFFITLHPMKVNGTYMNSFLFNLGLILLCSLPVVQFSTIAFSDYARFTNVNQIFGVQIKYLQFFSYFWTTNAFIYAILGMAVLSSVYLMCKPRDTPADPMKLKENLKMNRRR